MDITTTCVDDIQVPKKIEPVEESIVKVSEAELDNVAKENDNVNNTPIDETEKITDEKLVELEEKIDQTLTEVSTTEESYIPVSYEWNKIPILLTSAIEEYIPNDYCENFTKGCHWSPDGTCLLVPCEDFRCRLYDLPRELYSGKEPTTSLSSLKPALTIKDGGLIYDCCWYPLMNSWEPATCCFLSTSKETPVHLWDAFTGKLRATYRAYNQVDEVEAALSVQFVDDGKQIWAGYKGVLRSFDTDRPGRQINDISLKNDFPNARGIVSCIRENPTMPGLLAFGTYSKCIGLYKDGPLCLLKTDSGVTQIEFSPCGTKLYSVVRKNGQFVCWDLRNPGIILYSFEKRKSDTNQRIQFSMSYDGNDIISGGTDGYASVWRISESDCDAIEPFANIKLSKDCVNGVNIHKSLPILAVSTGRRICDDDESPRDNSVALWYFGQQENR